MVHHRGNRAQIRCRHVARIEVDKILGRYIPESERQKWPDKFYEIHYTDIIRGKNIFEFLDNGSRKMLSDEIFQLILKLKPVLFATAVDKLKMKQKYGNKAFNPRDLGFQGTIHRYAMYLNKKQSVGSVVIDQEEYRKDKRLQEMMHEFRRYGVILRGWNYQPKYEEKLERVLNTVTFATSETSPGIQLADVVARSTWTHFEHAKSNRFHQLMGLWNSDGTRIYDPSIFPK